MKPVDAYTLVYGRTSRVYAISMRILSKYQSYDIFRVLYVLVFSTYSELRQLSRLRVDPALTSFKIR
jgi:hypothetical protein